MKKNVTLKLVRAAAIAALYASLTILLAPISFNTTSLQVRVSEAMTLLPIIFPEAIAGLTIGCFISNLITGNVMDIVFGTLATLAAATLSYIIRRTVKNEWAKILLGALPPVIVNALVVPLTYLAISEIREQYLWGIFCVGAGQAIAVFALGIPLYLAIKQYYKRKNQGENEK